MGIRHLPVTTTVRRLKTSHFLSRSDKINMKSACWLLVVMMVVVDVYAGPDVPYSELTEAERQRRIRKPQDCYDQYFLIGQTRNDQYRVFFSDEEFPVMAYCDMSDGGGWTVIQRRKDEREDFNRDWVEYKEGFGEKESSFWIGNEDLYLLTNQRRYKLRIEMKDWRGRERYSECDNFVVGPESSKFKLISVGVCTGNAHDAMTYHLHNKFSTKDQDNDSWAKGSCAEQRKSGWWFEDKACSEGNLNGQYQKGGRLRSGEYGIEWLPWKGKKYSLKWTQMSVRPLYI